METNPEFTKFNLRPEIMQGLADLQFITPTAIQQETFPIISAGKDLVGSAQTGTGKTGAYLIPLLNKILESTNPKSQVLILSPTRELAIQIYEQAVGIAYHTKITLVPIYGGVGMNDQESALKAGADVIIATPGRLLDHIKRPFLPGLLDNITHVVIDEGDRMLDIGFLPDIRDILSRIPLKRQILLFSATIPTEIKTLIIQILKDPVFVGIQTSAPAHGVKQLVFPVTEEKKVPLLLHLIKEHEITSTIIFTATIRNANRLFSILNRRGLPVGLLHSGKEQSERITTWNKFRGGQLSILVATNVAARGLDIKEVSHVINFDIPQSADEYIHRVGRTARYDAEGDAFTFVTPPQARQLNQIEKILKQTVPRSTVLGINDQIRLELTPYRREQKHPIHRPPLRKHPSHLHSNASGTKSQKGGENQEAIKRRVIKED